VVTNYGRRATDPRESGQLRDILRRMSELTAILAAVEQGDARSAERLLPLVYDELRRLAAQKLAHENPGQTLQATALVHEAYLRVVGGDGGTGRSWDHRGHFFAAAAEAMRRILVDAARHKRALKCGGEMERCELADSRIVAPEADTDVIALNDALDRLAAVDPEAAQLVKLRFFAGLTSQQAAEALGVSTRTAERMWTYARSFLFKEMS
jgi:RNA polymerase sigma factor (TIGR02999 family)